MKTPAVLFCLSLASLGLAASMPPLADALIPAIAATLAGAILLVRALLNPPKPAPRRILVDGSNVLYWHENTPRIETVRAVARRLETLGFTPKVIFDATAGYHIENRYMGGRHLAALLGLPEHQVYVVPKGTSADTFLLEEAHESDIAIVTNDRSRDWLDDHPQAHAPGRLIRGDFRNGTLWLEGLQVAPAPQA